MHRARALSPKRTAKQGTARPLSQSAPARVVAESLGLQRVPQRYFPQCRDCSQKQAAAVRAHRRTLRMHFGGVRPWHFAGGPSAHACTCTCTCQCRLHPAWQPVQGAQGLPDPAVLLSHLDPAHAPAGG